VVTLLLLARRYGSLLGGQHCGITRNGGKFILKADIQGHLSDSWVRVEHQRNHLSVLMFVFLFLNKQCNIHPASYVLVT